jgi:hypothetical protein
MCILCCFATKGRVSHGVSIESAVVDWGGTVDIGFAVGLDELV